MTEKIEYCIWQAYVGQMDKSTDWEKLYKLCERNGWYYGYSKLSIIPTSSVGKGKYRTVEQMQADTRRMYHEAMNYGKRKKT